jgi:hypothetical protein
MVFCLIAKVAPSLLFVVLLLICRVLKIKQMTSLFLVSLLFFGLAADPFRIYLSGYPMVKSYVFEPYQNILIALVVLGLSYVLCLILNKFFSSYGLKIISLYLFFSGIFYAIYHYGVSDKHFMVFFIAGVVFFARIIHYLSIFLFDREELSIKTFSARVFPPFWDNSFAPRTQLDIQLASESQDALDKYALKVLSIGVSLLVIGKILQAYCFGFTLFGSDIFQGKAQLPDLIRLELSTEIINLYPRYQILASLLVSRLNIIFNFFSVGLLFDGCYLLLGYSLPLHFQNIFKARNFGEFFSRLMPYYSYYIVKIFLYPSYHRFRRLKLSKETSYSLSLAFAIIIGGFCYHLTRDIQFAFEVGAERYFTRYLFNGLFYFGLLFVSIRFLKIRSDKANVLKTAMVFLCWFAIYSFIFLFRVDFLLMAEDQKIKFILAFLGAA